jgi:hypothetical protein
MKRSMSILDTSALPAYTDDALASAIDWLNKRLSRYDASELRSFTVVPAKNRHWYDRSKPSKASDWKYAPVAYLRNGDDYPCNLTPKTGTFADRATGDWEFTSQELSLAGPDEQLVFSTACTAFFWLRRTGQIPTSVYGRAAETSAHKCGIDWLEDYRRRTLPGMGRRAAIMAQKARRRAPSKLA